MGFFYHSPPPLSYFLCCKIKKVSFLLIPSGKWEVTGEQQQASARVMMGQYFGSASGTVLCEEELTVLEAKCEYGLEGAQTHSLALSARLTEQMAGGGRSLEGRVSVQVSG